MMPCLLASTQVINARQAVFIALATRKKADMKKTSKKMRKNIDVRFFFTNFATIIVNSVTGHQYLNDEKH